MNRPAAAIRVGISIRVALAIIELDALDVNPIDHDAFTPTLGATLLEFDHAVADRDQLAVHPAPVLEHQGVSPQRDDRWTRTKYRPVPTRREVSHRAPLNVLIIEPNEASPG